MYADTDYNYYATVDKITVPKKFTSGNNPAFDYGLVIFQENPRNKPSNCCLKITALSAAPGTLTFPASSYALQNRDAQTDFGLYKTKIKEFENLPMKSVRYIKNDITFDLLGKGAPIIGNDPQGGNEKVVVGINISNVIGRPGMSFSPLWVDNDINNLWKCLERGTIECDVQAP